MKIYEAPKIAARITWSSWSFVTNSLVRAGDLQRPRGPKQVYAEAFSLKFEIWKFEIFNRFNRNCLRAIGNVTTKNSASCPYCLLNAVCGPIQKQFQELKLLVCKAANGARLRIGFGWVWCKNASSIMPPSNLEVLRWSHTVSTRHLKIISVKSSSSGPGFQILKQTALVSNLCRSLQAIRLEFEFWRFCQFGFIGEPPRCVHRSSSWPTNIGPRSNEFGCHQFL